MKKVLLSTLALSLIASVSLYGIDENSTEAVPPVPKGLVSKIGSGMYGAGSAVVTPLYNGGKSVGTGIYNGGAATVNGLAAAGSYTYETAKPVVTNKWVLISGAAAALAYTAYKVNQKGVEESMRTVKSAASKAAEYKKTALAAVGTGTALYLGKRLLVK